MQQVYTARQAIFNRKENVVAYELFFRDGPENYFPQDYCPHKATSKLIARTHLNAGIHSITAKRPALINFSEESLLKGLPLLLDKNEVVIEILETVTPSDEVYEACLHLRKKGFSLALDDFVYKPEWRKFLKLVKMIKFDLMVTPLDEITELVESLKASKYNIKLLAEKVETKKEFIQARKLGFSFFQGFYFCRPEMHKSKDIQSNQHILFLLHREVLRENLNHNKIASLFEKDINLSTKLLTHINNGGLNLQTKISSIKQALVYLGDVQVRRILSLITTSVLASNKPAELTKMCVIRAKFCELVMKRIAPGMVESAFLAGMFSLLDAILDQPMACVLEKLPLSDEIEDVLLDEEDKCQTPLAITLRIVRLLEHGHWHLTEKEALKIRLDHEYLASCYTRSVQWAEFQGEI